MRSRIKRHPKLAVLLVVVLALVFAGVGFAIWSMQQQTSNFQGQGATTITLTFATPTAGQLSAAAQCVPGGSCPLLAQVSNPATAPITLTSYQPSVANGFGDGASCMSPSVTGPAQGTASVPISPGIVVAAGASNQLVTIPNALSFAATAGSACQGALLTEVTGHLTATFTAGS